MNPQIKKGPFTVFYEKAKEIRKRPIPEELIKKINERVEKEDASERRQSNRKQKIAKPSKDELGL